MPAMPRVSIVPVRAALAVALLLQTLPVRAGSPPPDVAAATAPVGGESFGPGDRLSVTVFGHPELSGDYSLDGHGSFTMPLVGAIGAADLTPDQLERKIGDALADGYIRQPRVSVRAGELRPVYVLGDVRTAGAVAFRHGMTVLTAIAMAGGPASTQLDAMSFRGDLLQAEERLETLLTQRTALLARVARLTARRDGSATLEFPANLSQGDAATAQLLAGERAVFEGEREAEARQTELLTQQINDAGKAVASIAEQIRVERRQLDLMSGYVTDLTKLSRDGFVERKRVIDIQQEKSRLEADLARLGTDQLHAAQLIQESPLRIAEIRANARQQALQGLQEANTHLNEIETGIETARELVAVRHQRVGSASLARAMDPPRILVTRAGPDGPKTFEVQESMVLSPGDIVRVSGGGGVQISGASPDATPDSGPRRQ